MNGPHQVIGAYGHGRHCVPEPKHVFVVYRHPCAPTTYAESKTMQQEKPLSHEALALERVIGAAREVYTASTALEVHFEEEGRQPPTLELARFPAKMQELRHARSVGRFGFG